jgi:hypothetical protein
MDDKPVIEKLPTDEVVEKFKVAYDLKAKALLLQREADELDAKAEYHAKKARFWRRVMYTGLGVAFACQVFNLVLHYLRTHP